MNTENIAAALAARRLPPLRSRAEMTEILLREEYGRVPGVACEWTSGEVTIVEKRMCAGTVEFSHSALTAASANGTHTFPVWRLLHHDGEKHPTFIFLDFHTEFPSLYFPAEEIADRGFDVVAACYKEISSDDGNFADGLSRVLFGEGGRKSPYDCGKLGVWAYAASRMLDYALTLPSVDPARTAVIGHSRLGKTALLAAALDTRFYCACANDSGCCGDALFRGNSGVERVSGEYGKFGETIADITAKFPYWFCENFLQYAQTNIPADFDQHWLIASVAPRRVALGCADMDDWADPRSQFLSACAASAAWESLGLPGLIAPDRQPKAGERFGEGNISFHKRHGKHFLSRFDWNRYMDFLDR